MYNPSNVKRQKTKDSRVGESNEFFAGVPRIEYKCVGCGTEDSFHYRYYNASELVHGRTMEEWLRPALALSVTRPYVTMTMQHKQETTIDTYKKAMTAAAELCTKLGVKWWSASDTDLTPEGDTFQETQHYVDQMTDFLLELQQKSSIRPLYLSADLGSHVRYINGSCTNPDILIKSCAGYQVKRALDMGHKLGADCFLFSGHEGYCSQLNVDSSREIKHYAVFLKMIANYKEQMGYRQQLLFDCCQNDKKKTLFFNNPMSTLCFLKQHNLDGYYKLNISPTENISEIFVFDAFGSLKITKYSDLNIKDITLLMRRVVQLGGITPGGLNICLPQCDGPFEAQDLAETYISCIDMYAKGLRLAVKLVNDSQLNRNIQSQYLNYSSGWGARFENSNATLEECEEYVRKNVHVSNIKTSATRCEHYNMLLMRHVHSNLK